MAGPVIQATGRTDFEDGLRTGTKLEVRNGLQSVHTISEVNMVNPLGLAKTLGAVWGQNSCVRVKAKSKLPSPAQLVVSNYLCYCDVRIELA